VNLVNEMIFRKDAKIQKTRLEIVRQIIVTE